MKGLALIVFVALACLMIQTAWAEDYAMPKFISMGNCDEHCSRYPNAVCKVDCESIAPDGSGINCINNFYNDQGVMVFCYEK